MFSWKNFRKVEFLIHLSINCLFALPVNLTQPHKCLDANLARSEKDSICFQDETKCNEKVCDSEMKQCQAVYRNISGKLQHWYLSCFNHGQLECGFDRCPLHYLPNHNLWYCCCSTSMCNSRVDHPTLKPYLSPPADANVIYPTLMVKIINSTPKKKVVKRNSPYLVLVYILVPLSIVIAALGIFAFIKWRYKNGKNINLMVYEPVLPKYEYLNIIHQGQFTKHWLVQNQDRKMVVKLLMPTLHDLWINEKSIFLNYKLKHQHVINFLAAETEIMNNKLQYLLVVEYYEKGSLIDFLKKNVITIPQLLKFVFGIVRGLVYLHTADNIKPRIAHRDLKSANILVTNDLDCVICDFGLAIAVSRNNCKTCFWKAQVGTRRYMAPEILDGAIMFNSESYFLMDIYSTALIIWELLLRCKSESGLPNHYQPPYFDEVGENPSIWQMKDCVVDRNIRPQILTEWRNNTILNTICITMEECWDGDPEARVSANCIHERLLSIKEQTGMELPLLQEDTMQNPLLVQE